MTCRRTLLALCLTLLLGAAGASTQTGVSPWHTLIVPGGFAALQHAARFRGPAPDARTIPLVIELSFAGVEGVRFSRYIEEHATLLRRLQQQASAVSPDRTIRLAQRQARRVEFDALLDTLGLEYVPSRGAVARRGGPGSKARIDVLRRAGLPIDTIVERLNAGGSVSVATTDGVAPLPLGEAFWAQRFDPAPPPQDLLWRILASRELSSLLYGLMGLDDDTLRAVGADAALAAACTRHARVLPTMAPALRIHGGRVEPAGGAGLGPLWEYLVGERLDSPARFVNALLGADQGRLAHFYRTFDALPASTAAWIAGGSAPDVTDRRERFRRAFERFRVSLADWRADAMIQPPPNGPSDVLLILAMRRDGAIAGPPWRDFWRRAFDAGSWPSDPAHEAAKIDTEDRLDAAALLELVCPAACDPTRIATLALLQREFPHPPPDLMPALLGAARARIRYPSLALEVERMRLADPYAYLHLGSLASKIEELGGPAQALALVQLQSAIAVLSRLRAIGVSASTVGEHVRTLAALPVGAGGFDGGLVRWLGRVFTAEPGEDLDAAALRWLAGGGTRTPGVQLEWEGLAYRVDLGASEEARIRAARERFDGNSLAVAEGFVRLADDVPRALAGGEIASVIAAVNSTAAAARDPEVWWTGEAVRFESFRSRARAVTKTLGQLKSSDRKRAERVAREIRAAADVAAADALASLVYALPVQDADNPYALSRELPRRHHLRPAGAGGRRESPWALPGERHPSSGMRYISGSLLGIDAGVTELAVRRLAAARPHQEPNMPPLLAVGLQRTAALTSVWNVDAEDIARIDAARLRGEEIVRSSTTAASIDRLLTRAGIVGPRAGWLRWAFARGEPVDDLVRLEDLVRLGGWSPATKYSWGAGEPPTICLCLTMPALSWEMRGQPRDPEAAAVTIVEPALRVAVELRRRNLPAALAPGVLALLTTDLIDNAALPAPTDVAAILESVARVTPARFEDYIAAIAARGPLVVVAEGEGARR